MLASDNLRRGVLVNVQRWQATRDGVRVDRLSILLHFKDRVLPNKVTIGYMSYYILGGLSPDCLLADSRCISDCIPRVQQHLSFNCSNYIGNEFLIAIRHLWEV